ncbi:hypothetical protein ACHAXS_009586 [Conticribra weissflogii]
MVGSSSPEAGFPVVGTTNTIAAAAAVVNSASHSHSHSQNQSHNDTAPPQQQQQQQKQQQQQQKQPYQATVVAPPPRPLTPNPDDTDVDADTDVGTSNFDDSERTLTNLHGGHYCSDDLLPPITTASLPSKRQLEIANQSWESVSARTPLGCRDRPPSFETLVDFAATILETRLADVAKHRRDVLLAPPSSNHSSMTSEKGGTFGCGGAIDEEGEGGPGGANGCAGSGSGSGSGKGHAPVVLLTSTCRRQIRDYVRRIAGMYRSNRYHALEHAVHVTMSANKLLDMLHEGTVESDDDDMEMDVIPSAGKASSSSAAAAAGAGSHSVPHSEPHPEPHSEHHAPKFASHLRSASVPRRATSHRSTTTTTAPPLPSTPPFLVSSSPSSSAPHTPRPKRHKRSSTYLIYSSTFTKFSFVFAAYIHDVDHQGVPNARLVHENDPLARLYSGKSVAEKHSIKVAFRTLQEPPFDELRSIIFESPDDHLHMHRIVTNLVISTDIASPERMQTTKHRWEQAFSPAGPPPGPLPFGRLSLAAHSPPNDEEIATVTASEPRLVSLKDNPPTPVVPGSSSSSSSSSYAAEVESIESTVVHRRSSLKRVLQRNGGHHPTVEYHVAPSHPTPTHHDEKMALRHGVVIETMINVADVAHSMQSWELFCFWNRNLYEELFDAYKRKRSDSDPAKGWYENQLFFYKIYVLPLAEKMKTCGVFGELGGAFYRNAISIRDRWEREGEEITKEMIASVERRYRGDVFAASSSTSSSSNTSINSSS